MVTSEALFVLIANLKLYKRTGERANKKYFTESSEDIVTNRHYQIFKLLVADKKQLQIQLKLFRVLI